MRSDLKAIPMPPQPLFTVAEKKRIVVEAAGFVLLIAMIFATYCLFAVMTEAPEPTAIKGEVMSK